MEKNALKLCSSYAGACVVLTTKHAKATAIAPPFWDRLEASVLEYVVDTDQLGTFSGETKREGTALECARRKCEWSIQSYEGKIEYALASEGSFGPHPFIPFVSCDHEVLYFIDKKHDFHLHLTHYSTRTNFNAKSISAWEELQKFANVAQFPSHALILRPNKRGDNFQIYKGLKTQEALEEAFYKAQKYSCDGLVWVETDMRAHMNPSRMEVIKELAIMFAERLGTNCPKCDTPGWGKVRVEKGLECALCGLETELIKSEYFGCVKCDYEEVRDRSDGLNKAEPKNCEYCNP